MLIHSFTYGIELNNGKVLIPVLPVTVTLANCLLVPSLVTSNTMSFIRRLSISLGLALVSLDTA